MDGFYKLSNLLSILINIDNKNVVNKNELKVKYFYRFDIFLI